MGEIKGREDKPSASPVWVGEVQRSSDDEKEIVVAGAYGFRNNASPFIRKLVQQKKWNTSYAEIQRIVVDKRYRRKGLGKKMMDIIMEEITKVDDQASILLQTCDLLPTASLMYSKMNFETFFEVATHWPPRLASILPFKLIAMRRKL